MKKQKTFFEKLGDLKGKPGTIELTEEDKKQFLEGNEKSIEKESEKFDKYIWLLIGLGFGILGNFVVMLFYDWIKNQGGWRFGLMSFSLILLFLMLTYILFDKFREHKENLNFGYKSRDLWRKAKSLNVGPAVKAMTEEEFKEYKQQLKTPKPKQ